jgi:CBS domain-containing protein
MSEHRLPVFTRIVHSTPGTVEKAHHVMCPRQAHALDADVCWQCPEVSGAVQDRTTGEVVLVCEPEGVEPAAAPPADARATPVHAAMTREVHCVTADVGMDAIADLFADHAIGSAPVVDERGRPVGIVTKTDLLRSLQTRTAGPTPRVADVMTPIAFSIADNASVAQAAALMAFEQVHHVPVVSGDGAVVGVMSSLDVARFVGSAAGFTCARTPAR